MDSYRLYMDCKPLNLLGTPGTPELRVASGWLKWIQGHWAQHARSESGCDQAQAGTLFVGEINEA
jgi:hypothetical protein